jgi:hypothetical protein
MGDDVDIFKTLIPVLSLTGMCIGIYLTYRWQTHSRQNEEIEKQKALDVAINMLREHSANALAIHCEKTDKLYVEIAGTLATINTRLSVIEAKTELFWSTIESNFGRILKSFPTNIDKDVLLTKLIEKRLDLDEANILKEILMNELEAQQQDDKNGAITYTWLIAAVDQRIFDMERKKKSYAPHYDDTPR